jgi:hypothetical protein
MRKAVLFGFVLVCVTAVSFVAITPVERKVLDSERAVTLAAASKPAQVEVTNFPAVQAVSGSVNVVNLPVDSDGRILVVGRPAPAVHFAGYTAATFAEGTGLLALNRACQSEFPATRVCRGLEMVDMVPAPPVVVPNQGGDPSLPGYAFLVSYAQSNPATGGPEGGATIPFSSCMSALGVPFDCGGLPMVVACCGF